MVRKSKQYYLDALKNGTLERGEYVFLLNDGVIHIGFYENGELWTGGYNSKLIYKATDTCEEVLQIFKSNKSIFQLQLDYDYPKSEFQENQVRLLDDGTIIGLRYYYGHKSDGSSKFVCYSSQGARDIPGHGPECRNLYPSLIDMPYETLKKSKLLFTVKDKSLFSWFSAAFVYENYTEQEWKNNDNLCHNLQSDKEYFLEMNPKFDESIFDINKVKVMGD